MTRKSSRASSSRVSYPKRRAAQQQSLALLSGRIAALDRDTARPCKVRLKVDRRVAEQVAKEAEASRWTVDRLWAEYKRMNPGLNNAS